MSGLVLKLRPKERFLINGAVLQNGDRRSSIVVVSDNANVLRMKDAIHPEDAKTPVKRVCYIAQLVLAGEAEPTEARHQLLRGIEQLSQVFTDVESQKWLHLATENAVAGHFYQTLKNLRSLLARESRLLEMQKS